MSSLIFTERGGRERKNELNRGSVSIEATLSFTFALLIIFASLGTLLTLYVDTQMAWVLSNTSQRLKWMPEVMEANDNTLILLFSEAVQTEIIDQGLGNLIKNPQIVREKSNIPEVGVWSLNYGYAFLAFKNTAQASVYYTSGLPDDGLSFESGTVYITTYGEKYHLETCFHLRKSKFPLDIEAAIERGYEACKNCHGSLEVQ